MGEVMAGKQNIYSRGLTSVSHTQAEGCSTQRINLVSTVQLGPASMVGRETTLILWERDLDAMMENDDTRRALVHALERYYIKQVAPETLTA